MNRARRALAWSAVLAWAAIDADAGWGRDKVGSGATYPQATAFRTVAQLQGIEPRAPAGPLRPPPALLRVAAGTDEPEREDPAEEDELPLSKDALFGVDAKPEPGEGAAPGGSALGPAEPAARRGLSLRGFVQSEVAYRYSQPGQWSRAVTRMQVGSQGALNASTKWKAEFRLDVDPVYFLSDRYPDPVKDDQRAYLQIRETYLDTAAAGWDFRLGRQQVVWGEVVGLFFADVVSARDLRDFILPQFDIVRTPQWAVRAEKFGERVNAELVWIPFPTYDNIGKPGSEFYPFPTEAAVIPGATVEFRDPIKPSTSLDHTNGGLRLSTLVAGWDLAGFFYSSMDASPTFYRQVLPGTIPTVVFEPRHDRIYQYGGTVSKDLAGTVVRGEVVYTHGRKYSVTRTDVADGVVPMDTLGYVVSADFTPLRDVRLNLQYFETRFYDYDASVLLLVDRIESGVSGLVKAEHGKWEPELLVIQSLERSERLLRPRLNWKFEKNWRLSFGADIFAGPQRGYFGRYADRDRAYVEMRYTF